jgi:hypothetical protein
MGVGAALVASALGLAVMGHGIAWQEILISAFLFLTAPLSALYLAKTHILRSIGSQGPAPQRNRRALGHAGAGRPQDPDRNLTIRSAFPRPPLARPPPAWHRPPASRTRLGEAR